MSSVTPAQSFISERTQPTEVLSNFWFGSQEVRFVKKSMRILYQISCFSQSETSSRCELFLRIQLAGPEPKLTIFSVYSFVNPNSKHHNIFEIVVQEKFQVVKIFSLQKLEFSICKRLRMITLCKTSLRTECQ